MNKILTIIVLLINTVFSQHVDCIGGSITRNGYPGNANKLMEDNGYAWRIHNYGVPGASVVANNPYRKKDEYATVICRKAQIVVILLGANDWKWYFEDTDGSRKAKWRNDYKKLVKEYKKNSVVILGTLTHRVSVNGGDVTNANNTADEMSIVVRSIASQYGLGVIDFQSAIGDNPAHFWSSDGLHPNSLGSQKMGEACYNYIKNMSVIYGNVSSCQETNPDPIAVIDIKQAMSRSECAYFNWSEVLEANSYAFSKSTLRNKKWIYGQGRDGIDNTSTEYSDCVVELGDYIMYRIRAYKGNKLIAESRAFSITIEVQSGIEDPEIVSMTFSWEQLPEGIYYQWDAVEGTTHYKLSTAYKTDVWHYWWDDTVTTTDYFHLNSNYVYDWDYFCGVKAYKHNVLIGESDKSTVRLVLELGVDDEYWDAVRDYEEQKKIGWFGCQKR